MLVLYFVNFYLYFIMHYVDLKWLLNVGVFDFQSPIIEMKSNASLFLSGLDGLL